MRYDAIFFDVGGTMLFPDLDRYLAPLFARGVRPTAEQFWHAEHAAKHMHLRKPGDEATMSPAHWYVYFTTLLGEVGHEDLLPALMKNAADSSFWTLHAPGVTDALNALAGDYRLAVISNADGGIRNLLERTGLLSYFSSVIDSGTVGVEKPDRRIFEIALREMDVAPERSLYIGDIYHVDYLGATGAGMDALLMDVPGVYGDLGVPAVESWVEAIEWIGERAAARV